MPRSTKWKFAILAGISECLVFAEAKYCAFEIHGDVKYYVCPRTEYCCNFGCCMSPGFQIYHLWYYWLLVIIMFLVCSGGGWWYRYWLQGRYRAGATTLPHRSYNARVQHSARGSACQAQQARISYNTARNTVLLHRMWKGPHRDVNTPAYNTAASSTHFQSTSVVLSDTDCPYYQLYGPPPSYETVIAQTRGKWHGCSKPAFMSPEQSRILPNPAANQCFAHSYMPPPRIDEVPEGAEPQQNGSTIMPAEVIGHSHCSSHFFPANAAQPDSCPNHCPVNATDDNFHLYKDNFQRIATIISDQFSDAQNLPLAEGSGAEHQDAARHIAGGSKTLKEIKRTSKLTGGIISKVHGQGGSEKSRPPRSRSSQNLRKEDESRVTLSFLKASKSVDKSKNSNGRSRDDPKSSSRPGQQVSNDKATISEGTSSNASSSQSNPSNNVILAPPTSNVVIDMSATGSSANDADERRLLLSAMQGSTNSNSESNCKLDRSRSLD